MVAKDPRPPIEVVVTESEAGTRIDRVLAERPLGTSRSTLQRWIDEGRVLVDGNVADRRTRLKAGAHVLVQPAAPPVSNALPEDIPLEILYEDSHLLVINKPPRLVVHPAPGHATGTLVNALLHHAHLAGDDSSTRPGIVHRLDKDTSGVMVVAKTESCREGLIAQFKAHTIEREYEAIVVGVPPAAITYDTQHARHRVDRKRFTSRTNRGKRAVTHMRNIEQLKGAACVRCRLETGRTHQIRVHLAEHGHPVLGDPVYGRTPRDPNVRAAAEALGRQALHAAVLGFIHPATGEALRFEALPPEDYMLARTALS